MTSQTRVHDPSPSTARGAAIGVAAAAVALGVAQFVAGFSSRLRSPVLDIGDRVIDLVPSAIKEFAIDVFGTADKPALVIGILTILAIVAAGIGIATVKWGTRFGIAGVGAFGVAGGIAAATGVAGPVGAVPSVVGAVVGAIALVVMSQWRQPRPSEDDPHFGASRRSFLAGTGVVVGAAIGLGAIGSLLDRRFDVDEGAASASLPTAPEPLPAVPAATAFEDIDGLSPFTTPNADFYRIDTALTVPRVPIEGYTLSIKGMVDNPMELSFQDLVSRPLIESDITMTCVSNEIGGNLVGNARWLGVRLDDLLEEAGMQSGADQIVGRSVDNYTCGFPVSVLDGRDALVAVGMNGEALPLEHGFPARLIVPGLYGYVSATKWLAEIEVTTFDDFDHYWVDRGWDAQAPIKTQSRIDTPKPLRRVPPGPTAVAGVAWAQTRGVERVEVRVDGGDWQEAELAEQLNDTTWRQWKFEWDAAPGRHDIACRATDATGEVQTEDRARPIPNGASGWHSIVVLVDE